MAAKELEELNESDVETWSESDVVKWLSNLDFADYFHEVFKKHKIDGFSLIRLTESDIKSMGINALGDVKRIYGRISRLRLKYRLEIDDNAVDLPCCCSCLKSPKINDFNTQNSNCLRPLPNSKLKRKRAYSSDSQPDIPTNPADQIQIGSTGVWFSYKKGVATNLKSEYFKTLVSCLYMFLVTWLTAIVMVFVHDRVPDTTRHPPLPDIFLDNVPYIPWAFQMCEITIIFLLSAWIVTLYFHKNRSILLRRFAAIAGSVFLLRCATMFITSLSVPGLHQECVPRNQTDIWTKLEQAYIIWSGGGLSIKGVRTCGDYMFSGHATALTILNFFITEYTSRRMYFLHIVTWVLNMFGIFFILAAHEHYSIDVFIAFYITSRMFMYYHSLANNRALQQRDSFRTKIWFPMFSYFEADIDGIVPNEYSNPLCGESIEYAFIIFSNFRKRYFNISSQESRKSNLVTQAQKKRR